MSDFQPTPNGALLRQALDIAERQFLAAPATPSVVEVDVLANATGEILGRATWRPDAERKWAISAELGAHVREKGTGYVRVRVVR